MLPPKLQNRYHSIKSQENSQCLIIRPFKQYLPDPANRILRSRPVNLSRPVSSKLSYKTRISSTNVTKNSSAAKITIDYTQPDQKKCSQFKVNLPLPQITSKYWAIYELSTNQFLQGNKINKRIQVASLTKIMNLYTIIYIITKYDVKPELVKVTINELAASMIGTSASLKKRDILTLQDLLYGMMLPSGNDAAYQIAMVGGTIIKLAQLQKIDKVYDRQELDNLVDCRSNVIRYVTMMNKLSIDLKMKRTKWANPHGLSNKQNRTTIQDICILCKFALNNFHIKKIVNTKYYTCFIESYFGNEVKELTWENTNKLLWMKGWTGIKTGVTPNAGPCLAALFESKNKDERDRQYLVVIASCISMNQRWTQVESLVKWAIDNQII